ncbi:DUF4595 domain-containing protein [Paraflavitalea sp. CAU 1676]|uniref:DUF4595 domain-containing protein n=1 Tax=Paraflavitalea sp. CAU 1676 TaxID=3032598 RepID=UPI0023DAE54B|nr:DUF4595 domain-containing protein [Paraflavitalea sp. CAU 1676]MDF2187286.1 DUF4595 domain-containing protein [Paraflavitalea sp. CAU 1676]
MKRIHCIGLLMALMVGIFMPACKKELSYEGGYVAPIGTEAWEFKQGSAAYLGPIDTAYYLNTGSVNSLVLEGTSTDKTGNFYLEIIGANIITGNYATPSVVFGYYNNGTLIYSNDPLAANKFSVTITSIDTAGVSGTFTGEVLDTTGAVVTVTDGKFAAKFTSTTPGPVPTGCRISNVASYELTNGDKIGAITSYFNSQEQVIKTEVIDSTAQTSGTVTNTFNITYSPTQIKVDTDQYFTLDGSGRISSFHGYFDPSDNSSPALVIDYTYDANGYMVKAEAGLQAFPALKIAKSEYTWTNGNLTQVKITDNIVGNATTVTYEYDLTEEGNVFLAFHPNPEILMFQNAINYGKNSVNVPVKSTRTDTDSGGTPTGPSTTAEFINYEFDANHNVTSFEATGQESVYGVDVKHVLTYRCK